MNLDLDLRVVDACHQAAHAIASEVTEFAEQHTTVSIERATERLLDVGLDTVRQRVIERKALRESYPPAHKPMRYVLTATGDIEQDILHAEAVANAGGDVIAVIRSTAQSLLDYVPEGPMPGGTGGTYATQYNMRAMRQAMDAWSEKNGRYIWVSNFCSGLCMPEIAAIGVLEGLDNMVNDALYGILYRDINMQRTLIDQRFSRMLNGWAGITINTGEDNYLRTDDAISGAHTVTASQFINYHLACQAGVTDEHIGLGHAFEVDPRTENSLLYELAHACLAATLFPQCPTKFMPPTRYMDGNFYATHASDTLFNLVAVLTNQSIQTIGVPSEGMHTPQIHDRVYALQCVDYVQRATVSLSNELELNPEGFVVRRAQSVLRAAYKLLEGIAEGGLFAAIESGVFGDVVRSRDGGKGYDGVLVRSPDYSNAIEVMCNGRTVA